MVYLLLCEKFAKSFDNITISSRNVYFFVLATNFNLGAPYILLKVSSTFQTISNSKNQRIRNERLQQCQHIIFFFFLPFHDFGLWLIAVFEIVSRIELGSKCQLQHNFSTSSVLRRIFFFWNRYKVQKYHLRECIFGLWVGILFLRIPNVCTYVMNHRTQFFNW